MGRRQGVGDASNLFHYHRLTRDDRILRGGYDAVYHSGSRIDRSLERGVTHDLLARRFFATFPQLEGLRFAHRWAGVIDTCTRFTAFFDPGYGGTLAAGAGPCGDRLRLVSRAAEGLVGGVEAGRDCCP